MSWTLSVSARKREFDDALEAATASPDGVGGAEADQVDAIKSLASDLVNTFDEDSGMVGLSASGAGGASGLVSFSLSVASEADTPPAAEPAVAPELAEARLAAGSRYAPGERPEAPGVIDREAVATAQQAEADDPRRAGYRPDLEPAEPPSKPTSLAEDHKRVATERAASRPTGKPASTSPRK